MLMKNVGQALPPACAAQAACIHPGKIARKRACRVETPLDTMRNRPLGLGLFL
jgi:hypothetical protein